MDSSKSFLPRPFTNGGYHVLVNADRSIRVRQGDSLSKYSMAIYSNFDNIGKFSRKKGLQYEQVVKTNKDLILTGEVLYHMDPLPGELENDAPVDIHPLYVQHVADFFRWIKHDFDPSEWVANANIGINFNVSFFGDGWGVVDMVDTDHNPANPPPTRRYGVTGGELVYGWPGDHFIRTERPSCVFFGKPGSVLQPFCPSGERGLVFDDFYGRILAIETAVDVAGFADGRSVTAIVFGAGLSCAATNAALDDCLRYGQFGALDVIFKRTGVGIALVAGHNRLAPGRMAARWGRMYPLS